MEIAEYQNIFDNEQSHFYYVGTHNAVILFLEKYLKNPRENRILDAGCGTGALIKKMKTFGLVYGIDMSDEALKFAKKNGVSTVKKGSVEKIQFPDNYFDAVVSIDVLYHKNVKNDTQALREFKRVLKPGGILIIKNPAHDWLRGSHDIIIHTGRRYEKNEFRTKLNNVGFKIIKHSYINMFFLPFAFIKRVIDKLLGKTGESDVRPLPQPINNFLIWVYNLEARLFLGPGTPFGLSLFSICKKPQRVM